MGKLSNIFEDYQLFNGIKIYPFLMKDYDLFEDTTPILLFDKNKIPDIKIIKMSYLKFLICILPNAVDENGNKVYEDITIKFNKLLDYIFKEQEYEWGFIEGEKIVIRVKMDKSIIEESNKQIEEISIHFPIIKELLKNKEINQKEYNTQFEDFQKQIEKLVKLQYVDINEQDFNSLKVFILKQNAIPTIDETMHPDAKKALEESIQYLSKRQGYEDGTFEEQVISYKCEMKISDYNVIKNMSIYQFRQELLRLDLIKDFQIYKTGEMSGMVSFSKSIPHWRSHISNTPDYSQLIMDKQVLDSQMSEVLK